MTVWSSGEKYRRWWSRIEKGEHWTLVCELLRPKRQWGWEVGSVIAERPRLPDHLIRARRRGHPLPIQVLVVVPPRCGFVVLGDEQDPGAEIVEK